MDFVDREAELEGLEKVYAKGSGLFVLYGRRRVGKTELIKQFMEDKEGFYFLARQQDLELEAERLINEFGEQFDVYMESESLEDVIVEIVRKVDQKLVLVIDEFPYWIEEDDAIVSVFQSLWDEHLSEQDVFLVLTGSSVGMMESQVLDYESPLYGRRSGQLELGELSVGDIQEFLPGYGFEDVLRVYGAVGGIPFYLEEFESGKSFYENVQGTFLSKVNMLYEEAEILLREELRKPNVYFNIMEAVINGATTLNEISNRSKVDVTNVNKYLNVLERLKLLERETPVTEPDKKKNSIYRLDDNYFRFWLKFVYPNQSTIETSPDQVLERIRSSYPEYMGEVFEDICRETVRQTGKYTDTGRWWYKEDEIDIAAINEKEDILLAGECKWTKEKVRISLLRDLEEDVEKIRWRNDQRSQRFALFSRSGFTKELETESSDREDLELYDLERLEENFD
jgi:AAA+ ATPase superfamily predicted ATPase